MTGAADRRHVPAAGHRQVRRALRHPGRARRRRPPPRTARHRMQPGLRRRAGHGAPARSASPPAPRRRSTWRTSTCCATGRPPTRRRTRRQAARVNLLNWDGKGRPEGLFPPPSRWRRRVTTDADVGGRAGPRRCCCATPTTRPWHALPILRPARPGAAARPPVGGRCGAVAGHRRARHRPGPTLPPTMSRLFDFRRRCCLHLTYYTGGDTRKRGEALVAFAADYKAAGLRSSTGTARLPARRARLCRRRPTTVAGGCCARTASGSTCCRGAGRREVRLPARHRGGSAMLPPAQPGDHRPPPPAWPATGPPDGAGRPGTVRTRSTRPEAADERACFGSSTRTCHRGARRRADLALPLRQVRLDHPLLPALRNAPSCAGAARCSTSASSWSSRTHRRAAHPEGVDRGGRYHRDTPTT